jgi:hypothetical protein
MDRHEQRCTIKLLFLQEKRYKATLRRLARVLTKNAVSIETVSEVQSHNDGL